MRDANTPRSVIDALCRKYELVPLELVLELMSDDRQCGLPPLGFGESLDCAEHDALMICSKHGYPVETSEALSVRLVEQATETGLKGLRDFALWPFKILVGAPVGWVMDRWRSVR
jgi:hypothetical protein